jgi:hypothetical protein
MADLSITTTNMIAVSGYYPVDLLAGEAVARGKVAYTKAADGAAWIATAIGTAAQAAVTGIFLNDAAAGQPVRMISSGNLGFGAILTVGMIYVLSDAGAIAPITDLTNSDFISVIGIATTTGNMLLTIINTGIEATA